MAVRMAERKWVYFFGEAGVNKALLGGKGSFLGDMTKIGLPVPPGFTITTEACNKFYSSGKKWPAGLDAEVDGNIGKIEEKTGKKFGDPAKPLLVSVRSGAAVSMPGMMDTVLNLGLNDQTVEGLARLTGNDRFAYDSYRRFIQMFGDVVMGVEHSRFEEVLEEAKKTKGVEYDTDLTVDDLKEIVKKYRDIIKQEKGKEFPHDPREQLRMSIDAVFNSWNTNRAIVYRNLHGLPHDMGTGVNVQTMVFGNMGNDCGTGVGFTRNPSTGRKEHYGEYLVNAQGEDVVAGIRTPKHIDEMKKDLPEAYEELVKIYDLLEKHYKDMQDFEFTVEKGKLFMLQTRSGKRTAHAAVRIAVDMVDEGLITKKEAVLTAVQNMHEANPMMGLRGIRLGIILPGLIGMQVRAIFEAACNQAKEGIDVHPEIMIPLTGHVRELEFVQPKLEEVAKAVMKEKEIKINYKFGTMIEIPRAALTADEVAEVAQFFSYGTNDLTQMTFGYSRDDAERGFLLRYVEEGILPENPFQVLDRDGVGQLVKMGAAKGRATRPELTIGICGEHGGEPSSIEFCHLAGLNYVSCSPFRVPVARLAAAHAAINHRSQA